MNRPISFDDLLWIIRDGGLDERRSALYALTERAEAGLSEPEAVCALEWAAQPLPSIGGFDVSSALIAAVAIRPRVSHIEVVQRMYSRLPSRSARAHALDLLNGLTGRAAVEAYAQLLRDYDPRQALDTLAVEGLRGLPRHADALFPMLFRWAEEPPFRREVLELALDYARAGLLTADRLAAHAVPLVEVLGELSAKVRGIAGVGDAQWRWADEYRPTRSFAAVVIELAGHLPMPVAEAPLRDALRLPDPLLRLTALRALGRTEDPFELMTAFDTDGLIAGLGGDLETRAKLHRWLDGRGAHDRMPAPLRDERAVAAGALAERLLAHPELDALPAELELVVTIVPGAEESQRFHLFRFRYDPGHAAAGAGWMAGLAGPFTAGSIAPDCVATALEPWSHRTPAEHLRRLTAV